MPEFNDLNSLFSHLEKEIKKTMLDDVVKASKQTMSEKIKTTVYDAYSPKYYDRKKERYGLQDQEHNMGIYELDNGFELRNTRVDWDGGSYRDVAYRVEYGYGSGDEPYNQPRPFHAETAKELEKGIAKEALKDGLKKRGIDVE